MKQLLFILSITLVFAACSHRVAPTSSNQSLIWDSTWIERGATLKDTVITDPADSAFGSISLIANMPSWTLDTSWYSKSGQLQASVKIAGGRIQVICREDSLKRRIQWLEWQLTEYLYRSLKTQDKQIITVPVPTPHIPKWVWWLIVFNVVYFGLKITSAFYMPSNGLLKVVFGLFK